MNSGIVGRLGSLLASARLPARLNAEQTAELLGVQPHDIPALMRAGLLKPLGGGPRNCVKYFASIDIEDKSRDVRWLDKATKALSRRQPSGQGSPASSESNTATV
jgi:hypothetical protein